MDRSGMIVEAYELGQCATVCTTNIPGLDRTQILSRWRSFVRATANSSSATYDNVLTRLAIHYASAVWDYWEHQLSDKKISYKVVLAVSIALFSGSEWPAGFGNTAPFDFVSQKIVDELVEAAPNSTADGVLSYVHRSDASPRQGDMLVVPVNSSFAWLLRFQDNDTYTLVSTCDLRQLEVGHCAPLISEDFASSRDLKNFSII